MTRLKLAIFSTLVAIGLHAYLAWTYYPLKFAQSSGESFCNLNATFNCDAVAASSFSSLLGAPMALWGLTTNIVFLFILLIYGLRFTDEAERTLRNSFYLAVFIAATSIVMGSISLFLINSLCIFCIAAYICSFVTLMALWQLVKIQSSDFINDIKSLFSKNKSFLILLVSIPVFTYILHASMMREYGAEKLQQIINSSLVEWSSNPKQEIDLAPSLFIGPDRDSARLTISEFADFLCGHCKHASPTLEAFAKSHPDVRFEFYSFALDGECNEVVNAKVGAPCVLAKAVYCAGKTDKGWEVHNTIFKNQDLFYTARTTSAATEALKTLTESKVDNWNDLLECINSEETLEQIKKQGKKGEQVGVKGTPSIYANGKLLPRGQLLPVLQGLYNQLK
ncbi:MAG: DsbA family protein [Bdellovibrionaceae bacterium]|nr:DsbA family protein [Pseudobdellovibrionaceae bacterium]